MKKIILALTCLLLVGCDSGKKHLEERVQSLERENAAIKAERDALKTERDALKAQVASASAVVAVQQENALKNVAHESAQSYLRRCANALAMMQIDAAELKLPNELDGASCNDPALGENAVEPTPGVSESIISLKNDNQDFEITVTDSYGKKYTFSNP